MKQKAKRYFVALMCVMMAVTFMPSFAWAEVSEPKVETRAKANYMDMCDRKPGDIVGAYVDLFNIDLYGDTDLNIKIKAYEDAEHEVAYDLTQHEGVKDNWTITAGTWVRETWRAPVPFQIDDINFDKETSTLEYALHKLSWSMGDYNVGSIIYPYDFLTLNAANFSEKDIKLNINVYKDASHTQLIDNGEGCTFTTIMLAGGGVKEEYQYGKQVRFAGIIDNTADAQPTLTFVFHDIESEITDEQRNQMESLEKKLTEELTSINGKTIDLKFANPDNLQIEDLTKDYMLQRAFDMALKMEIGATTEIRTTESIAQLVYRAYEDPEMTIEANLADGKECYLDLGYSIYHRFGDIEIYYEINAEKPCKAKFSFVDVDENSKEVKQVIKNMQQEVENEIKIYYSDLSWINVLTTVGLDALYPPNKNNNFTSVLKSRTPELYNSLIGNTNLEVKLEFGMGGVAGMFSSVVSGSHLYYADGIYYATSIKTQPGVYMSNVLYVDKKSSNRAASAETRVDNYLKGSKWDSKVVGLKQADFLPFVDRESPWGAPDEAQAVYMTEYGLAFYNHPTETTQEHFLYLETFVESEYLTDVFANGQLEQVKTVEYMDFGWPESAKENVKAVQPYKLTLSNSDTGETKDFLYAIAIGDKEDLKEPYADWKDKDTEIITKGMNGHVPADTYTKIRVIKGGEELKVIEKNFKNGEDVKAFDINAFTNFKDGKLEDLGAGRMKVMIPLGDLDEEGVGAHYFDQDGKRHDLEFTIEEYEGQKYVCFITDHFSVYGISSGGEIIETGNTGENTPPTPGQPIPETGDQLNLGFWIGIMVVVLAVAVFIIIKNRK